MVIQLHVDTVFVKTMSDSDTATTEKHLNRWNGIVLLQLVGVKKLSCECYRYYYVNNTCETATHVCVCTCVLQC